MNHIIWKGYKEPLVQDDLFNLPRKINNSTICKKVVEWSSLGLTFDEFCQGGILQVPSQISPGFPFINQRHCPDSFNYSDNLEMRHCLLKMWILQVCMYIFKNY